MGRDIPKREEEGEEKLHVGNLSRNVSEQHLKEIFSNFGSFSLAFVRRPRERAPNRRAMNFVVFCAFCKVPSKV